MTEFMARLVLERDCFKWETDFDFEREIAAKAGMLFSARYRALTTTSYKVAARLRDYADERAKRQLSKVIIEESPWYGPLPYPEKLTPKPFQLEAALFALGRNRSYLALDPGLGKTVIAAIINNALGIPCLFITPPALHLNADAEFRKWNTGYMPLIASDSVIHRDEQKQICIDYADQARGNALLIVDEAHRFKTGTAKRTQSLFEIAKHFKRQVYLSGTPMPNRPYELYDVLSNAAPETIDFRTREEYGDYFCDGHWDGFAMNYSGAKNMKELQKKVYGNFMLRMRKADVLKELPPKFEQMVMLSEMAPPKLMEMERKLLAEHSPSDLMESQFGAIHLASYMRLLGAHKVNPALDFLKTMLEDTHESILIFAHHKEVIARLAEGLSRYEPFVVVGDTPLEERHRSVTKFQSDKNRRVFIGNYTAAGLGLTLTKATRVVFVEFSWTPSVNDQASDRAHRIGQKDFVIVQYLVFSNSIDRKVMEACFRKKSVTGYI